jgi:phosphatidylethanolamine-binding protein (PEBP) family uncharacterized protein
MRGRLGCASARIATVVFAPAAYNGFGCKGGNISRALSWSNTPAGTLSFALLVAFNVHAQALGSAELTGIYGR